MQNYGKFRKIKILKPIKSAYLAHVKSVYAVRPVTTFWPPWNKTLAIIGPRKLKFWLVTFFCMGNPKQLVPLMIHPKSKWGDILADKNRKKWKI